MRRRVVVTGMGCICPVGHSPGEAWKAIQDGQSGVAAISRFDASGFPTRIAAQVPNFELGKWIDPDLLPSFSKSWLNIQFGVAAAAQAVRDCGLDTRDLLDPSRFGVYLGAGEGAQDFPLFMQLIADSIDDTGNCNLSRFTELGLQRLDPEFEQYQEPNVLAA